MEAIRHLLGKRKSYPVLVRILFILVFWIIFFLAVNPLGEDKLAQYSQSAENVGGLYRKGITPSITESFSLSQTILPYTDNLTRIDVPFSTYARTNNSKFSFAIFDSDKNELYSETIDASTLSDNSYYTFDFPTIKDTKGKRFEIIIKGIDGKEENSITTWIKDTDNDTFAYINGVKQEGILDMILVYENRWVYPLMLFLIMLGSFLCAAFISRPDEKAFLCICLMLGILFIVITPFRHLIDEDTHFLKSYAISRFNLNEDIVSGEIGFNLPASMGSITLYRWFRLNNNANLLFESVGPEMGFWANHYSSTIIPINHVIGAIGLFIASILHMSVGLSIWFGRLFNYLFYVITCYFAIKNAKYYKSIFFLIASLPISVWISASFSIDPILMSTSLLFISICLKYRFTPGLTTLEKKDMIILLLCGICIASVKYFVYLPVLTSIYAIPKRYISNKKRNAMIIASTLVIVLLGVWQMILLKRYSFVEDRNGNVDVAEQMRFVFANIGFTIRNFTAYIVDAIPWHFQNLYFISALPRVSNLLCTLTIFSGLIATDKCITVEEKYYNRLSVHFVLIFLLVLLLIMAALYVGFTPVGRFGIDGLQTRYLHPVLAFIMLPMSFTKITNCNKHHNIYLVMMAEINLLLALTGSLMDAMV